MFFTSRVQTDYPTLAAAFVRRVNLVVAVVCLDFDLDYGSVFRNQSAAARHGCGCSFYSA